MSFICFRFRIRVRQTGVKAKSSTQEHTCAQTAAHLKNGATRSFPEIKLGIGLIRFLLMSETLSSVFPFGKCNSSHSIPSPAFQPTRNVVFQFPSLLARVTRDLCIWTMVNLWSSTDLPIPPSLFGAMTIWLQGRGRTGAAELENLAIVEMWLCVPWVAFLIWKPAQRPGCPVLQPCFTVSAHPWWRGEDQVAKWKAGKRHVGALENVMLKRGEPHWGIIKLLRSTSFPQLGLVRASLSSWTSRVTCDSTLPKAVLSCTRWGARRQKQRSRKGAAVAGCLLTRPTKMLVLITQNEDLSASFRSGFCPFE